MLQANSDDDKEFESTKRKLMAQLIRALESRFDEKDEGVVKATQLLDFSKWPQCKTDIIGANQLTYYWF